MWLTEMALGNDRVGAGYCKVIKNDLSSGRPRTDRGSEGGTVPHDRSVQSSVGDGGGADAGGAAPEVHQQG